MVKKIISLSLVLSLATVSLPAHKTQDLAAMQKNDIEKAIALLEKMDVKERELLFKELKHCNYDNSRLIDWTGATVVMVSVMGAMVLARLAVLCCCEPEHCLKGRGDEESLIGHSRLG